MAKRRKQEDASTELRRRAEKALEERLAAGSATELSAEDAVRVIHELQVHQIELDMQNEELHRAQEELATAHERYLNLYDFAPVGYVTLNAEGKIQEANFTCAEMLGVERRVLMGNSLAQFFEWEDRDVIFLHYRQVFELGVRQSCEARVRKQNSVRYIRGGRKKDAIWYIRLDSIVEKQKEGELGLCRTALVDITEPKRLEKELVRVERLRALGEMSAGVSHNLNNMLTGIMGPAQLLLRYSEDEQVRADAKIILKSAERARDLVRRLHQSVRGEAEQGVRSVMIKPIVLQAVNDTQPRWKDEAEAQGIVIKVEQDVGQALEILGTVSGVYDLLVNLLLNAVDAMPGGGTVSILARAEEAGVELVVR
ncbi:MAG: PAS domain-containing protein, partial [bacterium]|nr:PAS domain-containing protein [bacterium]